MGMYDNLLGDTQLGGRFEKFEKVESSITKKLKNIYPNIPEDYL